MIPMEKNTAHSVWWGIEDFMQKKDEANQGLKENPNNLSVKVKIEYNRLTDLKYNVFSQNIFIFIIENPPRIFPPCIQFFI